MNYSPAAGDEPVQKNGSKSDFAFLRYCAPKFALPVTNSKTGTLNSTHFLNFRFLD